MIKNQSTRRLFGLISTALVASIMMQWLIIPRFSWNGVLAEGGDPLPPQMDAASAYNYSRVLSYGSDYGLIANTLNKHSHMETTYAAKVFDGTDNSDIDFITNPAHFMVGSLTPGSELGFGTNTLVDGTGGCYEFIIEAPQSVLDTIRYMDGFQVDDTTVHRVERTQEQINSSIDALLSNARTYASTFNTRAESPNYAFPSACIYDDPDDINTNSYILLNNGNMTINLTDDYADKVVYINVDATMLLAIAKNDGVSITKPDSTVVVFNFPDGISLPDDSRKFGCEIFINEIIVNGVHSKTGAKGHSSEFNSFTEVDSTVCRSIIWNVPGTRTVCLGDMGGVLNAPNSAVQSREGSTNGWIIADTMDVYVEHHFIYQDTSSASMGEFSFYIVKALTRQYGYNDEYSGDASHSVVVPDTSIHVEPNQFAFIWQEYTDDTYQTTVGDSTTAPVGSISTVPANAYFPHVTFFSDEGHTSDAHYVAPGTTESFYFRVTEDHTTAGVEGISNSDGYVDIQLDVTASSNGTFTYVVDYTSWTGQGNDVFIYNSERVDAIGTEFRLGSFYNRVDRDVEYGSLSINKIITIEGAEYSQGTSHPFAGVNTQFSYTVSRVIDGVTYYYDAAGNRFLTPQVITTTNMEYYYNGAGNVTLSHLPVGTYTITEVIDSTVSEITTTGGTTYYLDATDYDVAGASTQTVTVTTNNQSDISITNDYTTTPQYTGSLVITKLITLPAGGSLSDLDNIEFTISPAINGVSTLTLDPDNIAGTGWTYDDATGVFTYTFDSLVQGTEYTVTETADGTNATNNYDVVVVTPAPVTIPTDTTQDTSVTADVTNTYSEGQTQYGSLTVEKVQATGSDTIPAGASFEVTVTFSQAVNYAVNGGTPITTASDTYTTNLAVGDRVNLSNIPVGVTYTVAETAPGTGYGTPTYTNVTGSITAAGITATVANTYTAPTQYGSLTVEKIQAAGSDTIPAGASFEVTVTFSQAVNYAVNGGTPITTATNTYTTNLAVDGSVTLSNIPVGVTYTVAETAPGTGYGTPTYTNGTGSITAAGITATVANTYTAPTQYGSLTVEKIQAAGSDTIPAGASFEVTVTFSQAVNYAVNGGTPITTATNTYTTNLAVDGSVTLSNIPVGVTYTVAETAPGTGYGTPTYTNGTGSITAAGITATVANTYTAPTQYGSLTVEKIQAAGSDTIPAGASFEVTVTFSQAVNYAVNGGTPITTATNTYTTNLAVDGSVTLSNIPVGVTYTVAETAPGTGYGTPTYTNGTGSITTSGITATVANTYTQQIGSITIDKVISGTTPTADQTFTFDIYNSDAQGTQGSLVRSGVTVTVPANTQQSSAPAVISNLPSGYYLIVERTPSDIGSYKFSGVTYAVGGTTVTAVEVTDGHNTAVTATNTYTQETGGLTIEKVQATGSDTIPAGASFEVTVTFSQAVNYAVNGGTPITTASDTYTTNLAVGDRVNLSNIPVGVTYTVAETAPGTGYGTPTYTNVTGSITAAGITATVANTYTAPTQYGSLTVEKIQAAGSDTIPAGASFEVTVTFSQAVNYAVNGGTPITTATNTYTTNLAVDGSVTLSNIPVGVTYTVAETAPGTGYGTPTYTNGTGSITAAGITATVANTYTAPTQYGSLTVEKIQAAGSDTIPAGASFEVTVTFSQAVNYAVNGGTPITTATNTYTTNLAVDGSVTLSNIPVGVTYTVAETAPGTGYGTPTYTNGTGSITAAGITATVANTYTAPTQYGSLTVEKIQAAGSDTIPAGASFEVTVTFSQAVNYAVNGGTPITTATNTYTTNLAVDGSVTLSNIPVGVTYTVAETAPGTGYGTPTYTNETGSITAAGITATVANTYTAPAVTGSLKINKSVDGLGSDTLDAVTNFEFTVTWVDTSVTPNVTYYYYLNNGTTDVSTVEHTVVVRIAAGQVSGSVQLDGLIAGRAYTVTEVSGRIPASVVAGGNSYDYQSTTGEGNVSVIAANVPTNPATADVVNTYSASQPQPSTCNIDIDKTTVGGVEVAGATITLTNTNGTDLSGCTVGGGAQSSSISGNVITFVSGSNGVTTIVGLPDGDYVLEETIVPTVSGGTYTVATTIGFTINSGSVVDSSVTGITDGNGYQPSTGTANAVFVLFDNFTADPTQTTPSETTPTETTPSDTTPTETTPTETSSEDTQPAVPQYGCLVISKTISGTSLNELETITFVLTDTSCGATREVPALTLANVQSGLWGDAGNGTYYYIVEGLSAGVTYTVTESLDGHTSTYSLDAVNSITTGSAMIVANGTVYVTLTDAYVAGDGTTPTESSSSDESNPSDETSETTAPEVSSVTLDGQPLSPDSYTVNPDGTITLNDAVIRSLGSGDHTIVITYVNGATRTQTVHVDGADRDVAETGETSVNAVAAVVILSAMVLIYFSKKLRDEAEAEAEN